MLQKEPFDVNVEKSFDFVEKHLQSNLYAIIYLKCCFAKFEFA